MDAEIDVTKIPGYNPEWSISNRKPTPKTNELTVELPRELAHLYDDDNTFTQDEAPRVMKKYCCPVCWGELAEIYIQGEARVVVACPVHGNVCEIGRIMKSSVDLMLQHAHFQYGVVIRNLPDLWGNLREHQPKTERQNLRELGF